MRGYEHANGMSLDLWEEVYHTNELTLLALTDTFSTRAFFQVMRDVSSLFPHSLAPAQIPPNFCHAASDE
jgi:hypothetical protein